MPDLSVLIPARRERFLARTVQDVFANATADTEVIVVLDGEPADPLLTADPRLVVVQLSQSIGQRAATNLAARISRARYIMKLDAHCALAPGFDRTLIDAARTLGDDVTQIPAQYNLHVYDWICDSCGGRYDQAPHLTACPKCQQPVRMEMVWQIRERKRTTSWVFTPEPRFAYDWAGDKRHRRSADQIHDVMTSLGACFFMRRRRFNRLGGLDEAAGSWGSFGIEIACKSWLSGGRHVVNTGTWFGHFFRVGGIGFPYEIQGSQQEAARVRARQLWWENTWSGQVRPLKWLVEKFWPVPGWTETDLAAVRAAGATWSARRET